MKILRRKVTEEGELYHDMKMIKVEPDVSKESCVFFVWPLDIVHVIDEESPFYNMTASDLVKERFELLVVLEGTNETSNMNFQARSHNVSTSFFVLFASISGPPICQAKSFGDIDLSLCFCTVRSIRNFKLTFLLSTLHMKSILRYARPKLLKNFMNPTKSDKYRG